MAKDMTQGRIFPLIIKFTIPLVLGNLLQLTYNAMDSIIVGRFVGDEALAAVGTGNPLITLILLFVQGICLGASVLIATMYGAKEFDRLKRQVSTAMIAGIVFSLVVMVICLIITPLLLSVLQVDAEIMGEAVLYLRIILCGILFSFIYNFFASTLRAMGDSRSPLIFLSISAIINIIGDLIFVLWFSMGVVGCAISTVASEALICLLCWIYIKKRIPLLNLGRSWLVFDKGMLKETLQYGFVSAMQQSTVQLGKVGMQGIVNTQGVSAMAAFTAATRIDDFALIPEHNISHAMMSVMAQNRGAGKYERVKESFRVGLMLELGYGFIVGVALYLFARPIMELFSGSLEVIKLGEGYLKLIAFMYVIPALTNAIQGYFRGMGDLKVTLWSSIVNMGVRVLASIPLVFWLGKGVEALPWSYLAGWIAMILFEVPFLVKKRVWANGKAKIK